jgi:GTPase SAR1 family protein
MAPPDGDIQLDEPLGSADQSPLSQTKYAFSRQKLNEIIKMLRDCGTEGEIQLPKIAVIGNQSAGKSSLIEGISRIKVPRASGTCTRCPMEVALSRSDVEPWKCKVSLRFEHDSVPNCKSMGTHFFAETDHRDNVPLILRRAQLAILNPGDDISNFVNLDETQCKDHGISTNFSRNTVVMEITGADVDVTFIDLPGIISNTKEDHFIDLIKNLVDSYVSQEECLILVAISMKGTPCFTRLM